MASGHTPFREIAEGIKIFRDYGGKRAMLVSVTVDLHAARLNPGAEERFSLARGPVEATDWLHCLDELGDDDVCLVRLGHTEADLTEDDLRQIRALVPRSPNT